MVRKSRMNQLESIRVHAYCLMPGLLLAPISQCTIWGWGSWGPLRPDWAVSDRRAVRQTELQSCGAQPFVTLHAFVLFNCFVRLACLVLAAFCTESEHPTDCIMPRSNAVALFIVVGLHELFIIQKIVMNRPRIATFPSHELRRSGSGNSCSPVLRHKWITISN